LILPGGRGRISIDRSAPHVVAFVSPLLAFSLRGVLPWDCSHIGALVYHLPPLPPLLSHLLRQTSPLPQLVSCGSRGKAGPAGVFCEGFRLTATVASGPTFTKCFCWLCGRPVSPVSPRVADRPLQLSSLWLLRAVGTFQLAGFRLFRFS
jgi:hypothetical protein